MKCKSNFAEESMYDVKIYLELKPSSDSTFIDLINKKNKKKKFDEDVDHSSESSDESVRNIHFDI